METLQHMRWDTASTLGICIATAVVMAVLGVILDRGNQGRSTGKTVLRHDAALALAGLATFADTEFDQMLAQTRPDRVIVKENVDVRTDPKPAGTIFIGAPMPYFLRIVGGIGMHAGYLPGYPASHGCIRMPESKAKRFYEAARLGTPVTVKR